MSKGFFDIFREVFGPEQKKAEKYETLELEIESEAQALVIYALLNEGALRERDRIVAAFKDTDANWTTFALKKLEEIPRDLPRDE